MRCLRPARFILVLLAVSLPAAPGALAQTTRRTWEQGPRGQWEEVAAQPAPATQAAPDPQLDRVEQLLDARQFNPAEKLGIQWLLRPQHTPRATPHRDRALLLVARALFGTGERFKSFYYCDELMDEYPDSRLFYDALDLQYRIADAYLDGYKRKFLGMRILSADDEAIEMLYRIQSRSPGSDLAEKALLRTADYYFASGDFDFAGDAYGMYIRRYPRSPRTPRVRLRRAFASLAQFRGLRFDATSLIDAREQLRAIAATYPELAKEENVAEILDRVDASLAQKLLTRADFYRRTHEPQGAAYVYKYLIKAYPDSSESTEARRELARLPESARQVPGPESVGDDAHLTRPGGEVGGDPNLPPEVREIQQRYRNSASPQEP
jgi:outer membrane assembly lipoprotein YfiO